MIHLSSSQIVSFSLSILLFVLGRQTHFSQINRGIQNYKECEAEIDRINAAFLAKDGVDVPENGLDADTHEQLRKQRAPAELGWQLWQEDVLRSKRCLLNYLRHRLKKIRATRWDEGRILDDEKLSKLAPEEVEYLNQYNDIVEEYMGDWLPEKVPLNLATDLKIQTRAYSTIRILPLPGGAGGEGGEVVLSDERVIKLIPEHRFQVRTEDAETLVQDGVAVMVKHPGEEGRSNITPFGKYGN